MILENCLSTVFKNDYQFSEVLLVNDGSSPELSAAISDFVLKNQNHPNTKFSLMHFGKNQGYGQTAEFALNYAVVRNPKYLFIVEQDYVFRANWADIVMEIFEGSEIGRNALGFSGYDNEDFYKSDKINDIFPRIIVEDCGEDNLNRSIMYKPLEILSSQ